MDRRRAIRLVGAAGFGLGFYLSPFSCESLRARRDKERQKNIANDITIVQPLECDTSSLEHMLSCGSEKRWSAWKKDDSQAVPAARTPSLIYAERDGGAIRKQCMLLNKEGYFLTDWETTGRIEDRSGERMSLYDPQSGKTAEARIIAYSASANLGLGRIKPGVIDVEPCCLCRHDISEGYPLHAVRWELPKETDMIIATHLFGTQGLYKNLDMKEIMEGMKLVSRSGSVSGFEKDMSILFIADSDEKALSAGDGGTPFFCPGNELVGVYTSKLFRSRDGEIGDDNKYSYSFAGPRLIRGFIGRYVRQCRANIPNAPGKDDRQQRYKPKTEEELEVVPV